jgi:hypothetical protein
LLVSWCVGDRCDMAGSDEDLDWSTRPGAEDRGWSSIGRILCGRTIGRSGDTVCSLYHAHGDEEPGFFYLSSKPRSTVCQQFGLKTIGTVSPGLASKLVVMVSWLVPQNQAGFSLSVVPQNSWREVGVRHVSRSSSLLRVEASWARVS